jgi:hypothetical protein
MIPSLMKRSSPAWRRAVFASAPLALWLPACTPEGYDPTKNMGRADGSDVEKFVTVADGEVDAAALGKLGRYIRSQRQLGRGEEQILEALAKKEIAGYRFQRLRILEQKKEATTKRHQTQRAQRQSRQQARVAKIQQSPAPEKARQLELAEREHETETKREEAAMKREIVLIENEIKAERSKTYLVPVRDPKGSRDRSVVLIDSSNRVKNSKIYQIDRSVVDLAKVMASEEPDVAVLTDVKPLSLPGGP